MSVWVCIVAFIVYYYYPEWEVIIGAGLFSIAFELGEVASNIRRCK